MAAASASVVVHPLILRRLYRSLLKVSRPFTEQVPGHSSPVVLTCLLHRTGFGDNNNHNYYDDTDDDDEEDPTTLTLFRKLLRQVVAGDDDNIRLTQAPSNADPLRLRRIIRREFREISSKEFPIHVRKDVAFLALRELNKKLVFAETLRDQQKPPHAHQAARNVSLLPNNPLKCIQPGAFLLAHPNMRGYFRRSVICLLDQNRPPTDNNGPDHDEDLKGTPYGNYGLIVNRPSVSPTSGRIHQLHEVLQPLPNDLLDAFGGSVMKEGGPVHMSLQMLHLATSEQAEACKIGGSVVPVLPHTGGEISSTALETDKALYYRGDIFKATQAVASKQLDREDVSFFVGASVWTWGQLENELAMGHWLVCRGPTEIALTGMCEHDNDTNTKRPANDNDHEPTQRRPVADLWLSMMSACGKEEAELAHLLYHDDGQDENSKECDNF